MPHFAASVVEVLLEHTCFEVLKNPEALVWRLVLPNEHGVRTIDHRAIPAGHEAGAGLTRYHHYVNDKRVFWSKLLCTQTDVAYARKM